jgi:ABC-2 type transport system permease protein
VRGVFLQGSGVASLAGQLWPMGVIGVLTLVAAGWLFRRRIT